MTLAIARFYRRRLATERRPVGGLRDVVVLRRAVRFGVAHRSVCGLQSDEACVEFAPLLLIMFDPSAVRLNARAEVDKLGDGVSHGIRCVDVIAATQMRFDGGKCRHGRAEGRAFVRFEPLERPVQDRGQDLAHQVAAGNASRDGDPRDRLARLFVLLDAAGDQKRERLQGRSETLPAILRFARGPEQLGAGSHLERRFGDDERHHGDAVTARPRAAAPLFERFPINLRTEHPVEELRAVVVAPHPQIRSPVQPHHVERTGRRRAIRLRQIVRRRIDDGRITENDGHLPAVDRSPADQSRLLIVRSRKDERAMPRIEPGLKCQVLGQRSDRVEMVDNPRQLREGQAAMLLGRAAPRACRGTTLRFADP